MYMFASFITLLHIVRKSLSNNFSTFSTNNVNLRRRYMDEYKTTIKKVNFPVPVQKKTKKNRSNS